MPETLIIFLAAFAIHIVILGIDVLKPSHGTSAPGIPRRSTTGMFTVVALFGLISGWALPHAITEYGLPAGYGALMIVAIAITATLLSKRLWVLAERYRTRSQVVLIRMYYRDDGLAGLVSVLNGIMCVVFAALIFHLIGSVASHVTGLGITGFYLGVGSIALATILWCQARRRKAVSRADGVHFAIYILGVIGLGVLVLNQTDGFYTRRAVTTFSRTSNLLPASHAADIEAAT